MWCRLARAWAFFAVKSPLAGQSVSARAAVDGIAIPVVADLEVRPDPIREVIFGEKGMFQGVVDWQVEVPGGGANAVLHMPHSIQTIEWREDLMLELRDAAGQVLQRAPSSMRPRPTSAGSTAVRSISG